MTVITEGDLKFTFDGVLAVNRFDDDSQHGMSHCMKAVDFIIESNECYWFIEVKDPAHPNATQEVRNGFAKKLQTGKLSADLVGKYRDTFLYRWAADKLDKPIRYVVLLCMSALDDAAMLQQHDNLRRMLPADKAASWQKPLVDSCVVLSLKKWNEQFRRWPVSRLSDGNPTV